MSWLFFSLAAILLYGIWGALTKVALRHLDWAQVSLLYVLVGLLAIGGYIFLFGRRATWSSHGLALAVAAGVLGASGLICIYLALERGKASVIVPLTGAYPVVTVIIAALVLGERISVVQGLGIALAAVGIGLLSIGR